jgi:hypothetical protein
VSTTNGSVIVKPIFKLCCTSVENVLISFFTGHCDMCFELFWCDQQNKDVPIDLTKLPEKKVT